MISNPGWKPPLYQREGRVLSAVSGGGAHGKSFEVAKRQVERPPPITCYRHVTQYQPSSDQVMWWCGVRGGGGSPRWRHAHDSTRPSRLTATLGLKTKTAMTPQVRSFSWAVWKQFSDKIAFVRNVDLHWCGEAGAWQNDDSTRPHWIEPRGLKTPKFGDKRGMLQQRNIETDVPFCVVVIENIVLHGHFEFRHIFTHPPATEIKLAVILRRQRHQWLIDISSSHSWHASFNFHTHQRFFEHWYTVHKIRAKKSWRLFYLQGDKIVPLGSAWSICFHLS